MQNPFALEAHAREVMRQRQHEAAQAALAAQLPHHSATSFPRTDLAVRLRLPAALRGLAGRLDRRGEPALVAMNSR